MSDEINNNTEDKDFQNTNSLDYYLSLLNPEQTEAVIHSGSPLLILAGAGSGKTRVITTKIAYLIAKKNVNPYSILAVTFTKKAASEMHERAIKMESRAEAAQIRTFHSFGAWFLRRFAEDANINPNFTVYDDDDMVTLVTKAVPGLTRQQASSVAHKISLAKDYCLTPTSKELSDISSDAEFPSYYAAYEKRLRATGNVDFGDLIMLPVQILETNKIVSSQIHYRFKVIMVDEYQDANTAQFKLLKALSGVSDNPEENKNCAYVCVVGDDDQSIYKFRGAEVKNILSFQKQFPNTKIIKLERNYRSISEILHVADCVVSKNQDRLGKTLSAERGKGKKPVLTFLPTQDDEARFCADLIQKSHEKGVPYQDWAILYRTNAQSLGFESEFLHRKIPYTVVGSLKFYEREEIKDMLSYLSLAANPRDELAFRRIINKPAKGIGSTTQDKIIASAFASGTMENLVEAADAYSASASKKAKEGLHSFVTLMNDLNTLLNTENEKNLSEFVEKIMNASGLLEYHKAQDEISGTQRAANIQELANSAVLYKFSKEGLLEFLDHIELDRTLEKVDNNEEQDSVTLITLHNTKGLEFQRVVITGLEYGIFPRQDKTGSELEEERRLFYVGITRAKDELYITSCAQRRLYGHTQFMEPSPFLKEANVDSFKVLGKASAFFSSNITGDSSANVCHPLAEKWSKGSRVFHDDYGYGQIISGCVKDGEYVINVSFESGGTKKFLPAYQSSSLLIVKDN